MDLEPIAPETALELYLADRENEVTEATLRSHRSRLGHFIQWCDKEDLDNLNDLTGRRLQKYRVWRRNKGNLAPVSEKTQMDTLRVFIRWLESIDGAEQDLSTKVLSPTLASGENVRDVMLDSERADAILSCLSKYHYVSIQHVTVSLLWHTMMRIGALRALDLDDYSATGKYLKVRHRPESGTPIKNKYDGERHVALSDPICELIDDWIAEKRPESVDEFGRDALVTTSQGRVSKSSIRAYVYQWSQPCRYRSVCPHGREQSSCEATHRDHVSKCPSSISPHAVRRGSITYSLSQDVPAKVVSDRANVSPDVLDKHYDRRTSEEKMEQRRQYLSNL
ncbi:tyrosine-type recombinase/integrase [Halobium salinum]|uniref:Tyrosine-type recombinase/integrase n=1 Tax=Halobium salinum TaxID=1364940 RepID=A0ABD5P754_9EURY|nr:site-specific integrase [Halobium salinum]